MCQCTAHTRAAWWHAIGALMDRSSGGGMTQPPRVLEYPEPCPKGRCERGTERLSLADTAALLRAEARSHDVGWDRGF